MWSSHSLCGQLSPWFHRQKNHRLKIQCVRCESCCNSDAGLSVLGTRSRIKEGGPGVWLFCLWTHITSSNSTRNFPSGSKLLVCSESPMSTEFIILLLIRPAVSWLPQRNVNKASVPANCALPARLLFMVSQWLCPLAITSRKHWWRSVWGKKKSLILK